MAGLSQKRDKVVGFSFAWKGRPIRARGRTPLVLASGGAPRCCPAGLRDFRDGPELHRV